MIYVVLLCEIIGDFYHVFSHCKVWYPSKLFDISLHMQKIPSNIEYVIKAKMSILILKDCYLLHMYIFFSGIGLIYVDASVWQMLRGAIIIFAGILSVNTKSFYVIIKFSKSILTLTMVVGLIAYWRIIFKCAWERLKVLSL